MKTQHIIQAANGVLLACALMSTQAHALTLDAEVTFTPVAGSTVTNSQTSNTMAYAYIDQPACGGMGYGSCIGEASSDAMNTLSANVQNTLNGTVTATAGFTETWTNTSGQAQSYAFDFHLSNAMYQVSALAGYEPGFTNLSAGFRADIFLNGVSIWHTSTTALVNNTNYFISHDGVDISSGLLTSDAGIELIPSLDNIPFIHAQASYDYQTSINLGTFAHGEAFTLKYVLSSFTYSPDATFCGAECYQAYAGISDPFGLSGSGSIHAIPAVPEPETYALMLTGLGLIAAARRRLTTR